jgi:hypothetical protein
MIDEPRARMLAENELLAREVNERVGEVAGSWYDESESVEFICECSLEDCTERVRLRMREYREVRSDPHWFVMTPAHVIRQIERPVRTIGDVVIAEKVGAGREVVDEATPGA